VAAAKSKPEPIEPSHEAETEKPVIGEAEPVKRHSAESVAETIAASPALSATAHGNRVIVTFRNDADLVQQFSLTVEETVREF
jgi:hypothetical protein